MKRTIYLCMILAGLQGGLRGQSYTGPFTPLTLLPESVYDYIAGEASGEQAYYHVLELAPYEKDRPAADYASQLQETNYVFGKLQEYGLISDVERPGRTRTWDGVSATLWEVSPKRQKLADYRDLAAYLAQGSSSANVKTSLVWVGQGTAAELQAAGAKGNIIVTEAAGMRVQKAAIEAGAVGIVSFYAPRPLVDPLQVPNASITANTGLFCFNIPPRDGYALRDRLIAGESVQVEAKVETTELDVDLEVTTCLIPGTDKNAEEIIITAHLFEGYVKLGANDNTSGAAAILDVARTLNELITSGAIPPPKRNIRFLWIPEIRGSMAWSVLNPNITARALCNLNLDMVGLWLSKSDSYFCLQRTTMGNAHYVNDVVEALYHYVGATNKSFLATGAGRPAAIKPIYSVTGSQEPFYYSIVAHYGSSDHEVFNDFGVQVPGVMLITWPDNYYHTSGDRPSILDPTQLRRAVVIAATSAYLIASAGETEALKIAAEVVANGQRRLSLALEKHALRINEATADSLPKELKSALFALDACVINERATLQTVLELAPQGVALRSYVESQATNLLKSAQLLAKSAEELTRSRAELLAAAFKPLPLTPAEQKAAKVYPKATDLPLHLGVGSISNISRDTLRERDLLIPNGAEIARLTITSKNSILDIKKMLDAQFPNSESLDTVSRYLELLRELKMVTW